MCDHQRALQFILAVAFCGLASCTGSGGHYPIPKDDLPNVLVAVYLAEAEAELSGGSLRDARLTALLEMGYDTTQFNESMRALADDPEAGKEIFQVVLDSVIREQREIRARFLEQDE